MPRFPQTIWLPNRLAGLLYYLLLVVEVLPGLLYYLLLVVEVMILRFDVSTIAACSMTTGDIVVYYPADLSASNATASSSFVSLFSHSTKTIQSQYYL